MLAGDCPKLPLLFDVRVVREEELVVQLKETNEILLLDNAGTQVKKEQSKPNNLVIEIDSVSTEHANRHMPLTRELLQKHCIGSSTRHSIGKCLCDLCAVEFSKFAFVGPNSIANQVASLSGCITTLRHPTCFNGTFNVGDVCRDPTVKEFGLLLYSNGPKRHRVLCPVNTTNPFLYNIARENGFLTFFGEGFTIRKAHGWSRTMVSHEYTNDLAKVAILLEAYDVDKVHNS